MTFHSLAHFLQRRGCRGYGDARTERPAWRGGDHGRVGRRWTLAALRRMAPRNRGTIVQVGSALAYRAIPLQSAYCAAKHALEGFTESLRTELMHDGSGVHVTMVQLPALNTPQFDWSRSRMPRQPQAVPPIFQPELAADAIVWASTRRRRQVMVGWPTVKAFVGNTIAPRYVDWYLAKVGYDIQQTEEPTSSDRRDNLLAPLPGDHGAHGRFDARARSFSLQWWLSRHRAALVGAMALGLGVGTLLMRRADRTRTGPRRKRLVA